MTDEYEGYEEFADDNAVNYEESEDAEEDSTNYETQPSSYEMPEEVQTEDPYGYENNPYDGFSGLTKPQEETRYLLEPDDIPENVRKFFWAISSRHLELINVPTEAGLKDYNRRINKILRIGGWSRDAKEITINDTEQIKFFSQKILLPKSLGRGERTLIATTINRSESDYGDRPSGTVGTKPGVINTLKESLGSLFGG